jgi:hypothetical protein
MPMRRGSLLVILLAGCVSSEPSRPGVNWQSMKVDADPGPDRVLFDIALVQRPLGDSFLTDELWQAADEMIVPADQRELLELNGYRVGVLVGSPPEKLVQLLQSDRGRLDRKGRAAPSGTLLKQDLRECEETIEGFIQSGKNKDAFSLDRPRFGLDLMPALRANDVVRLKITPRIEEGDNAITYRPAPDVSQGSLKWSLEMKRPTRVLSDLAVEIDLAPNQVLVIGPRLEREGSLGVHSLTAELDGEPTQRLLVLRHLRTPTTNFEP